AKIGTFDTNAELVDAIKAGKIQWAVDQQPFLQGYLAIDSLWLYLNNRNTIGGGQPVLTGPAFIDKSNIGAIATMILPKDTTSPARATWCSRSSPFEAASSTKQSSGWRSICSTAESLI